MPSFVKENFIVYGLDYSKTGLKFDAIEVNGIKRTSAWNEITVEDIERVRVELTRAAAFGRIDSMKAAICYFNLVDSSANYLKPIFHRNHDFKPIPPVGGGDDVGMKVEEIMDAEPEIIDPPPRANPELEEWNSILKKMEVREADRERGQLAREAEEARLDRIAADRAASAKARRSTAPSPSPDVRFSPLFRRNDPNVGLEAKQNQLKALKQQNARLEDQLKSRNEIRLQKQVQQLTYQLKLSQLKNRISQWKLDLLPVERLPRKDVVLRRNRDVDQNIPILKRFDGGREARMRGMEKEKRVRFAEAGW